MKASAMVLNMLGLDGPLLLATAELDRCMNSTELVHNGVWSAHPAMKLKASSDIICSTVGYIARNFVSKCGLQQHAGSTRSAQPWLDDEPADQTGPSAQYHKETHGIRT